MKRGGLVFVLVVLWLVGGALSAHAFNVLDDKLSISGFAQNQSSYRLGDGSQWVSSENLLQVEMEARMIPGVMVAGTFRGIYDGIYEMRHSSDNWQSRYGGSRDALSKEAKVRELFVDTSLGNWDFRIGKQQVVWGESDGLRLMDLINPLDMRRQFVTREWKDIRVPQTMVKATYGIDPSTNSFFEFVWNPGDVQRDRALFDTDGSDRNKSPWTISNPPGLASLSAIGPAGPPSLRGGGLVAVSESDPSWLNVRSSEFGTRLGGTVGGFYMTLNYFQGFSKTSVVESNLIPLEPMLGIGPLGPAPYGPPPGNPPGSALPVSFKFEYPRETVVGFTFNKATGLWVWRGEFATYLNKHYNTTAYGYGLPNITVTDKVMQASMLGFDYKRFVTFLNAEKMFSFSAQVFNYHIFDYEDGLQTGPYAQKPRKDSYYLTLLVNTQYHMERICPEVLVVYDTAGTGWYAKPRVEFKYGDHWRPEIGALIFVGDLYEMPFGDFEKKDEVYVRLKYQF